MDEEEFWNVIASAQLEPTAHCSLREHYDKYLETVSRLSDENLKGFAQMHYKLRTRAGSCEMSQAAYIVNNGCGDDDFMNFCTGIIAHGKSIYYNCLREPESTLLDLETTPFLVKYEAFDYVPNHIQKMRCAKSGAQELDYHTLDVVRDEIQPDCFKSYSEDPVVLCAKFPRLFERYWKKD